MKVYPAEAEVTSVISSTPTSTLMPTKPGTSTMPATRSAGRRCIGRCGYWSESGLLQLRLTNRSAFEHDYESGTDHFDADMQPHRPEFRNDEILKLHDMISLTHGFRPTSYRFLITGVCSACSRSHTPRRRLDLI